MPPQQQQPQPPLPPTMTPGPGGNLDPNYGFIFNGQQQPTNNKFGLPIPRLNNTRKLIFIILAVAIGLIILIPILSTLFLRSGVNSAQLTDLMARSQEIRRESAIVEQKATDQNTKNLAATTQIALTSQQIDISSYIVSHKIKVKPASLQHYYNKNAETEIISAIQNNNLSTTYASYLKSDIGKYQNALKTASVGAPVKLQAILQNSYNSNQTLLTSKQISAL